jgi:hypothetical protein
MSIKDIIAEIQDDNRQIQKLAFLMYSRHTLKMALERKETDEARASKSKNYLDAITEESLRKDFEEYGYDTMSTKKDEWIKRATEQFNSK